MDNSSSSYQYSPLGPNEIRLLRIKHSWLSRTPTLELTQHNMEDCLPYIALSYTWGPSQSTRTISLNQQSMEVRENLYSFLKHARSNAEAPGSEMVYDANLAEIESDLRYLLPNFSTLDHFWVDALCIDQNNIPERNAQVSRMKDIYERAQTVVVWLGPADTDSDLAMDVIERLSSIFRRAKKVTATTSVDEALLSHADGKAIDDKSWTAVRRILHRPWFQRAWIIQEVSIPNSGQYPTAVWCGHRRIGWDYLYLANYFLHQVMLQKDSVNFSFIGNRNLHYLVDLKYTRQYPSTNGPLDLLRLLLTACLFDATDPRDNIFSILAIATDGNHEDIQPDYSRPVEEVYERFAMHMIQQNNSLDVMGYCFLERNFPLPSWVPDWSVRHIPTPFPKRFVQGKEGNKTYGNTYNACDGRPADAAFSSDRQTMAVRGIVFAVIEEISEPRALNINEDITQEADLARSWTQFALESAPHAPYPAEDTITILEALQHVLCADIDDDSEECAERGKTVQWHTLESGQQPNSFSAPMILHKTSRLRRLMRTLKGYLGIASMYAEVGDVVCVLFGGKVPMVLRRLGSCWVCISECYVHGVMDGEAVRDTPAEEVQNFLLR
jgi:hypothetical protein